MSSLPAFYPPPTLNRLDHNIDPNPQNQQLQVLKDGDVVRITKGDHAGKRAVVTRAAGVAGACWVVGLWLVSCRVLDVGGWCSAICPLLLLLWPHPPTGTRPNTPTNDTEIEKKTTGLQMIEVELEGSAAEVRAIKQTDCFPVRAVSYRPTF